jgi:hypothetical protein
MSSQLRILETAKIFIREAKARSEEPWSYPETVHIIPRWMFEEAERHGFKIVSTEWGVTLEDKEPAVDV